MADHEASNAILYLRPQTDQAIAALDLENNKPYTKTVAPPPEPTDIRFDGILDPTFTTHLAPHDIDEQDRNISRESTPGPYAVHPQVLRLGFDSNQKQPTRGFLFGSGPDSDVRLPYYGNESIEEGYYFRIQYNFNSGALLLTATEKLRIGSTVLKNNESLLLMADTMIESGGEAFRFVVEFPDLGQCANEHERNYGMYVARLGVPNAPYMATSRDEDPPIGYVHRSKALLGKGSFGEVHKAVNTKTGELCAIKQLSKGGENKPTGNQLHEAKLLSRLSHPNIIRYHDTFAFKGQVCIIMELAANDLLKHRDARKGGKRTPSLPLRCIQSVGRQALAAIQYLHAQGVTHRDLKPENILVTKWDSKTDLPTIKLADFGLASLKSDHATFCGTKGWLAPEIERAMARRKELQERHNRGMKTIARPFRYNNSVDIWALGKVLGDLLCDVPSSRCVRGKNVSAPKEPAIRLINRMMQEVPEKRPTASECLEDPWMVFDDSSSSFLATKRDRSLTPTSSAAQPLKKVVQNVPSTSVSGEERSTEILKSLMWPDRNVESRNFS